MNDGEFNMTVMVKPKKAEGVVLELNPTNVIISDTITLKDKTIYLPQDKRTYFNSLAYKQGDNIRLMYDRDGNYVDSERLPKRDLTKSELERIDRVVGKGGGESHTALEPEYPDMYIQEKSGVGPQDQPVHAPAMGPKTEKVYIQHDLGKGPKGPNEQLPTDPKKVGYVHIQADNVVAQPQQPHWITEREKNDTIVIQSLLSRAVDIVDAVTKEFPKTNIVSEKTDFADSLDARINNIEYVTDRLLAYVKAKVKPNDKTTDV
jgi:hypothetical protein